MNTSNNKSPFNKNNKNNNDNNNNNNNKRANRRANNRAHRYKKLTILNSNKNINYLFHDCYLTIYRIGFIYWGRRGRIERYL